MASPVHSILLCSHTGRGTGFGRIAADIATSLAAICSVNVIGLDTHRDDDAWIGHHHGRLDPTRTSALLRFAAAHRPRAIILIGQGQLLAWQTQRLREISYKGAIIAYVPMEGPVRNPAPLMGLAQADVLIAYTDTGASNLHAALTAPGSSDPVQREVKTVPHAICPARARPPESRQALRSRLFHLPSDKSSGTWILNANRNDLRKRPELTLRAFAQCVPRKEGCMLVLHCSPKRPDLDLRIERDRLGLRSEVIFTSDIKPGYWSEEELLLLYGCCDIGVNSALGEGWGLIAFEHALTGAAQIMPGHQGLREIWGAAPLWADIDQRLLPIDGVFYGQAPNVRSLATAMAKLIESPDEIQPIADACRNLAASPTFEWESVGAIWRSVVTEVLAASSCKMA